MNLRFDATIYWTRRRFELLSNSKSTNCTRQYLSNFCFENGSVFHRAYHVECVHATVCNISVQCRVAFASRGKLPGDDGKFCFVLHVNEIVVSGLSSTTNGRCTFCNRACRYSCRSKLSKSM